MFIEIKSCDFALTGPLRNHIRRRLNFALGCKADDIQRVRVWLENTNNPSSGCEKTCRLHIMLYRIPGIVIEDRQADLYMAIDRAADRAGNTISRKVSRQRDSWRTGMTA